MTSSSELPNVGTYHRYKLGQAQFTNWLKQTAEKLMPGKSSGAQQTQPAQQRNKQDAANVAASAYFGVDPRFDARVESTKPIMHWSQLEVFVQTVVENGNPAQIPPVAVNILRDVINLRKKSSKFYSSQANKTKDAKMQKSNLGHLHIIKILENVLAKLEEFVPWAGSGSKKKSDSPLGKDSSVTVADLTTMFTHLNVQAVEESGSESDSGDDETKATTSKRPQKAPKRKGPSKKSFKGKKKPEKQAKSPAKAEPDWIQELDFDLVPMEDNLYDDDFDYYMMVYCFFVDFNTIRNYVSERWCDYWYDRSVSLITLAVITNAAFELFNKMEAQLISTLGRAHRELARYDVMMGMLFHEVGMEHIDYESYEGLSEEETDERIWRDESDWLAYLSYCTIVQALKRIPQGKVPMIPPSDRSTPIYGATNLNSWRKFADSVTMQLITNAAHIKALKKNEQEYPILPAEPQILQDFQTALSLKSYTSALIFSVHLWTDIRFIMEEDVSNSLQELQITAREAKPVLLAHAPGTASREIELREQVRERVTEISNYMLNDCQYDDAMARFRKVGISEDPEKFFLLKNEPVWAGLLHFRLQLVRSELGHQFTALTCIVEAAAYLYQACRAADESLPDWEEMERYINTYADESQFKSMLRSCNTPESIIRNFERIMYAHQPAVKEWDKPNSSDTTFIPDVRIRRSLYRRYAWEDTSDRCSMRYLMELTLHKLRIERKDFEEVIRETGGRVRRNAKQRLIESGALTDTQGTGGDGNALVRQTKTMASSSRDGELAAERDFKRRAMLAQLSHVEMLQLLDETVTSQLEGLFKLDYFALYDESVAFLKVVLEAFGSELKGRVGYNESDTKTTAFLGKVPVHLVKNLDKESEPGSVLDGLVKAYKESLEIFPTLEHGTDFDSDYVVIGEGENAKIEPGPRNLELEGKT